jgi:enoyl-CoA hydratase/carnithine racemase
VADVYELVIDAPGKNSLSSVVMQDIVRRLDEANGRPVLVRGAGDAFSAGLNLKEVASLDVPGMARFLGHLDDMARALFTYEGPLVTCVNGHAIAGGCVIALAGDVRIATKDPRVRIGLNEVALGLEFPPMLMRVCAHRLSREHRERVMLEAGLYPPATALELGIVDELADDPVARGREVLATLAAHPPAIYAATKRTLRAGVADLTDADRRYFTEAVVPRWTAPAVKEQVLARLKR